MVTWLIGLSGAGKTTIGKEVYEQMKTNYPNTVFLDGDAFREIWGNDLGHSFEERRKNADRFCRMCKFLDQQRIHVVAAILSIFPESREWNRQNLSSYLEVYLEVSLDELKKRDTKGLYAKVMRGEIKDIAGVDLEFLPPSNPDIHIVNEGDQKVTDSVAKIVNQILRQI